MPETKETPPKSEISFQVMPKSGGNADFAEFTPPPPPTAAVDPLAPSKAPVPPTPASPHKSLSLVYIIITLIVLAILGGLVYYFLGSTIFGKPQAQQQVSTRLPKDFLNKYFQTDTCTQDAVCGDSADPDKDGLSNYKEFVAGTNPTLADTDGDGLADGDEVNVYGTDPTKKYTDPRDIAKQNDYTDGVEIRNGYDPTLPGTPLTDAKKQQIQTNIQAYGLHEPTPTTIKPATSAQQINTTAKAPQAPLKVNILGNVLPNIVVNAGDTVIWTNKDDTLHHIASDPHPTHTDIPGFESKDLAKGDTYSFTFTKVGIFGYHDHLNPLFKGTITVKQP